MNNFLPKLTAAFPLKSWQDVTALVAVSGGADSVALLRGLVLCKFVPFCLGEGRLIVAHFNHRLRGAESDEDERFVRKLAEDLGLVIEVGQANKGAPKRKRDSSEADFRQRRYDFLLETAQRVGARYIATGHTQDDQAETVLHRLLRGTGIAGLAGIPKAREIAQGISLVRPLLDISRANAREFLAALFQPYREDSSNVSSAFTRNRIRNELLPFLEKEYSPTLRASLLRLACLAEENQSLLASQVEPLLSRLVQFRGDEVVVDCAGLADIHRHLVRELFLRIWTEQHWPQQHMTLDKWDQLATLALEPAASAASCNLPGNIRAERQHAELRLRPRDV